ncbi:MAG: alpha/beta hydrolase [Bacteroidales bacterium]
MKSFLLFTALLMAGFSSMGSQPIEVTTTGSGDHVVIIAGFGGQEPWREVIKELSKSSTCHLVTIRGIDGSKSSDSLHVGVIVEEIVRFMHANAIEKPVVIGHSFGGFIAAKLAAGNAGIAKKLVMIDTFPFAPALMEPSLTQETGKQQAQMFRQHIMALPEQAYQGFWMQNMQLLVSDKTNQELIHHSITQSQRINVVQAQSAMLGTDLRLHLHQIQCPVLVLCSVASFLQAGLPDDLIRQRINEQFNNLPSCSIFIHPNARHFMMLDQGQWVVDNIRQFVER